MPRAQTQVHPDLGWRLCGLELLRDPEGEGLLQSQAPSLNQSSVLLSARSLLAVGKDVVKAARTLAARGSLGEAVGHEGGGWSTFV